jgi:phosphoribosylformylglycinamidine synthase subunit PurL
VHDVPDSNFYISLLEPAVPNELGFDSQTDKNFRKVASLIEES